MKTDTRDTIWFEVGVETAGRVRVECEHCAEWTLIAGERAGWQELVAQIEAHRIEHLTDDR